MEFAPRLPTPTHMLSLQSWQQHHSPYVWQQNWNYMLRNAFLCLRSCMGETSLLNVPSLLQAYIKKVFMISSVKRPQRATDTDIVYCPTGSQAYSLLCVFASSNLIFLFYMANILKKNKRHKQFL